MANIQGLRHLDKRPAAHRGRFLHVPGRNAFIVLGTLIAASAAALAVALIPGEASPRADHAPFVSHALGRPAPHAPRVRRPVAGIGVVLGSRGFSVNLNGKRDQRVELLDARSSAPWTSYAHGVRRPTSFGHEAVLVTPSRTEQYLTVDRHLGTKTWSWKLKTLNLKPRVGADGAIGFLDGNVLTSTTIAPPRIYDPSGGDITPAGTQWVLQGDKLSLILDDADLPVPYVVDPAITYKSGTYVGGSSASVILTIPNGVRVGDMLVAHIGVKNTTAITKPGPWTQVSTTVANSTTEAGIYYHRVISTDVPGTTTATWTLTATNDWVGGMIALAGVKGSAAPLFANATANSSTVTDASVAAVTAGSVDLSLFTLGSGNATLNYTTPAATTFIAQGQSTNATATSRVSASSDYFTQAVAGASTARSSSCTNCGAARNIGWQTAWPLDNVPATLTLTTPANTLRGTVLVQGNATEADSSLDVLFQYSPAGTNTWTQFGSTSQSTGFVSAAYSASFNTTLVGDGFYDIRMVGRDGAWASTADDAASTIATVRVDNSSPDQNLLSINELSGAAFQYFDSATNVQYYNPVGGNGTFTLNSAPRDVLSSIQYIGQASGGDGTGGPLTVNVPAGTLAGDVMIMQMTYETGTAATYVAPAGWTQVARIDPNATWGHVAFYKVATGSEPASYTFTLTNSAAANIAGGITTWRGVSTAVPINVSGTQSTLASLTITAPSLATTAGCERLLTLNGIWTQGPSVAPAASTTERYDVKSNELQWDTGGEFADEILSGAAGATGTRVATASNTGANSSADRTNAAIAIALRPKVCVSSVIFPAPGQTGFTGGGNTDAIEPYAATTYSFDNTNTTEPGAKTVTTNDEAGNTPLSTSFTMKRDVVGPAFASPPTAGGNYNALSVPVATTTATDTGGSGVDALTYTVERDTGTPTNGACAWNNVWAGVTLVGGNDTTVTAPGCYRYRMRALDNVSNVGTSAASSQVIVDQTVPNSAGTISIAESNASTYQSGTTLYYRPAGAGGTFDVTDTAPTDVHSGIGKVRFPGLTGGFTPTALTDDNAAPYTQTYTWTTGATDTGSKTVTVYDAAGNTVNASFTLTQDSTAPSSTTTVPAAGAKFRAATYPTSWSGTSTDGAGSGLAGVQISLKDPTGAYWNGATFSGGTETFNNVTGTTAWTWTAPALTTNGTYTAHVVATDNVGNPEVSTTSTFVYDTTAPTFGTLAMTKLGNCNANISLTSTSVFYNPVGVCANAFTMTQPLNDAGGSLASTVAFPAIASGNFAHSLDSATTPFTSSNYGWTLAGAAYGVAPVTQTLTGTDGAGNTATTSFTIQKDTAGATTAFTAPTAASFIKNGATISGTADDGVGNAGVSQVEFRYCSGGTCTYAGGTPLATVAAPGPYQTTWNSQPADGQYTILMRSTDNVGNLTDVTRTVNIDNTAPSFSSAAVNAAGTQVTLTFTEAGSGLDATSTTPGSAFTVLRNGSGDAVTSVTWVDATHIRLTLTTRVFDPDTVTVAYSTASLTVAQQEKDVAGNPVASFGAQTVSTASAASLAQTTVVAAPGSITANGTSTSTITVTLKNNAGTNLGASGGTVTMTTTSGSLGSVTDNGNGTYTATLTSSTSAGTATVTAKIDGTNVTSTASVIFTAGAVSSTQSTVSASPGSVLADGVTTSTITVTAKDAFGNALGSGQTVSLAQGGGSSTITPASTTTNGSGVATFTVKATAAQSVTYTATIGATGILQTASVTFTPGAATHFTVSAPASTTAGVLFSVTVTALDVNNNTATAYVGTVQFTSSDANSPTLPANYTFVGGDNGAHTFTNGIALKTQGSKAVVATDTVTSSVTGTTSVTVNPASAATLTVTTTAGNPQTAGVAFSTTVTAKDAYGNTATGYTGTVRFTTTDGNSPTLPANYTFLAGDNGTKSFNNGVTLKSSGTQTITATDTVTGTITGTSPSITMTAASAVTLTLTTTAGSPQTAGVAFSTTVTAKDSFGNNATGYTGGVHFTSSDAQSTTGSGLPADYTFVSGDNGTHTFTSGTTLKTVGSRTITATDTVVGTINGTTPSITVAPAAAATLTVTTTAGSPQTAGVAFSTTVTAKDAFTNVATGYTGTIRFTSTDGGSPTLPVNYTFTGGDAGVHTFTNGVVLKTVGPQTVTATDTVTGTITGTTGTITVAPAGAATLTVTAPANATAGVSFNTLVVTAKDAFGNTATGYTGTVAFSGGGTSPTLPGNYTFTGGDNGTKSFSATLTQAGSRTITATDTVTGTITGTTGTIAVSATFATTLRVTGAGTQTAGNAQPITVTAYDSYGNVATGYTGTHVITFGGATSSPSPVTLPTVTDNTAGAVAFGTATPLTFTGGVSTVGGSMKLYDAESATVTASATDGGAGGATTITASGADALAVTVSPAPFAKLNFQLSGPQTNGQAFTGTNTLTAQDAYGNTVLGFNSLADPVTVTRNAPLTGVVTSVHGGNVLNGAGDFVNGVADLMSLGLTYTGNAGTGSFLATASSGPTGTSNSITVAAAAAARFVVTGSAAQTAGQAQTLTVTAVDGSGNTATTYTGDHAVTLTGANSSPSPATAPTVTDKTGTPIAFGSPATLTFTAGVATSGGSATLYKAETANLVATAGALSTTGSDRLTVTVAAASASTLQLTAANSTPTAGTADDLTITARDPFGNVATSYTGDKSLTFGGAGSSPAPATVPTVSDKTGAARALGAATTITFANGVATVSGGNNGVLTLYKAETAAVTVTDGTRSNGAGTSFTVSPAAASKLAVLSVNGGSSPTAGSSFPVVVGSRDPFGNASAVTAGTSFALTRATGTGTLGGALTGTITAGQSQTTVAGVDYTKAETGVSVTATRTSGDPLTAATSATFIVSAIADRLVVISVNGGSDPVSGTPFSVTVQAQDGQGNQGNVSANTALALSRGSGTGTLGGTLTGTIPAGQSQVTISGVTYTKAETGVSVTATRTSGDIVLSGTSATFTVDPGAAARFAVAGSGTQTAGNPNQLTVTAYDAAGNVATGYTGDHNLTFSGAGSVGANTPTATTKTGSATTFGTATTITFTNGVSTAGASMKLYRAESATIVASAGDGGSGGNSAITTTGADRLSVVVSAATTSGFTITTSTGGAQTAGASADVTVTARDLYGNTTPAYAGTVAFSSDDTQALVPAQYSFTPGDAGVHTFTGGLTLKSSGSRTVTATDNTTPSITGTSPGVNVSAAALNHFTVTDSAAPTQTAGAPFNLTVTAKDAFGNTTTAYTGTADFGSTDPLAVLPGSYLFVAGDNGSHTFTGAVTLKTSGLQQVTVSDSVATSATGSTSVTVGPAAATTFTVSTSAGSPQTAGLAFGATVTAKDAYGNVATGYAGTVQFTSTDPQAVLPSNFVFGAGDLGTHTFTGGVTLKTTGGRTVTATDTVTPAITATSPAVTVAAAGAAKFVVTGAASQTAGTSQNLTLRAVDAFGNTATGYTGAHAITFSGATLSAGPVTPPTVTDNAGTARSFGVATNLVFSSGVANAAAGSNALTLYRAETANVTASATDGGSGSTAITTSGADRLTVSVGSAAANRLSVVTTAGNPQTAGTAFSATVTALDPFGNAATGYTGGIAFTTTDPLASPGSGLPAAYTFVPGDGGVHLFPSVTFKTAGAQTLTATDTVLAGITGTSAAATIAPTATDHFTLTHTAAGAQTAGAPFDLTVTAKDQFGNTTPAYTGTAAFTSSDIQAALPGSYAFQAADNGTKSFTGGVTLKTVGSRTVTATDTVTGSITGAATVNVGPAGADHLTVTTTAGSPQTAGGTFSVTVTAKDAFGNVTTGYTGTAHFTSTDAQATLPADYAFQAADNGTQTFTGVALKTAGSRTVTATDTVASSVTGTSAAVSVTAAAAAQLALGQDPTTTVAGTTVAPPVTARLLDAFGNQTTSTANVSVAIKAGTGSAGAALAGTLTRAASAGIATFNDLSITKAGSGYRLTATAPGVTSADSAAFNITPSSASAANSTLARVPATVTADGSSASTLTVQAKDVYGNALTTGGATVALGTDRGALSAVTDNGNGTYSATITATLAGTANITGTLNAGTLANSVAVSFVPGTTPNAGQSVISAAPTALAAGSPSAITVQAKDVNGNALAAGGATVILSTDRGTLTAVTDNGDGTYSATLNASTAGAANVTGTLNGSAIGTSATVSFTPGAANAAHSVISRAPSSIVANGGSTSTITVQVKDVNDNNLAVGATTVVLSTSKGTLGSITDNNNGTYTATLTSSTTTGTANITGTVNGTAIGNPTTVVFVPGAANAAQSLISAAPTTLVANGSSTSAVTVRVKDVNNNNLTAGGASVVLSTDKGSLGPVTDNGDGTYTTTLTSALTTGTATVTGTLNGTSIGTPATVTFTPGAANAAQTVIARSPASIVANGSSTSAITVQVKDVNGNNLTAGGATVTLNTNRGTLSTVTDNGNGTYTATLTSSTTTGTATITGTLGGTAIGNPTTVALTPGAANATQTVIARSPASIVANGSSTSAITVQVKDVNGNNLTAGGATVTLNTNRGTLSTVTDNGNGTYTATLTSSTTTGTATITGTLGGTAIGNPTTVAFVPGAAHPAHTVISAAPASRVADGASTSTVAVQLKDINDNNLTAGSATVALNTNRGTLSAVTDNGNGTYTATLTSTTAGAAVVTGTLNAASITSSATVTFVPGAVSAGSTHSTVIPSSGTQSTDSGTDAVTVTVRDANDNPIFGSSVTLAASGGSSLISPALGDLTDVNGQVVFTVSDTVAETVVYSATASGTLLVQTASVQFQPGVATQLAFAQQPTGASAAVTITPAVTVRILDAQGNVTTSTATVAVAIKSGTGAAGATLAGTASTPAVAGVATYNGLSIAKSGTGYRLTATATSLASADSGAFTITAGAVVAGNSTITASPSTINADGTSGTSTITVRARDVNNNNILTGGASVTLATNLGSLGSVSDNGDGTYTALLTATNASGTANITGTIGGSAIGNTTSVTLTPPVPVVTIDSGVPPAQTTATGATILFHSPNDGSSTFACELDGVGFTTCASPKAYSSLGDGLHTFKVHGINTNGTGSDVVRTWKVDTTGPTGSFTTTPGAYTKNATEPLVATATDVTTSVASVDFLFAATAGACPTGTLIGFDTSSPYTATWTTPADGTYFVCGVATDAVGNTSTFATAAIVVDLTKPVVSLSAFGTVVGPNTFVRATPALHATASDATSGVSAVNYSFSGLAAGSIANLAGAGTPGTTDSYDTTWPTGALGDGTYTVTATAIDKATNNEVSSRTVIVDNTLPAASLDDPGAFRSGTIPLTVTASDGGSGVKTSATAIQVSSAGANAWTTIGAPATWTPLNGTYDLRAIVQDNVGNSTTTAVRTVLVDNTPPLVSDNADAAWHLADVTVTLTATDAESGVTLPSGVQFKVDGGGFSSGTTVVIPAPANGSNDGTHTITYRSTNRAAVTSADQTATVKIDHTTPSSATLDAPTVGAAVRGTLNALLLSATATDATSPIASKIIRIAPAGTLGASPCNSFGTAIAPPFDTASVPDGHYDFWVAAADAAGNGLCSVTPHDVTVDNTAPVTTDNAPAGPQNHDVSVVLTPGSDLSGIAVTEYSLDGGTTWTPGTTVTILASSGDGTKTIKYRSRDNAGNVEVAKTTQVIIDMTAPGGSTSDPGAYLRGTVTLTYSATDPDVASVQFSYRPTGSSGAWTNIGAAVASAPYETPWITNAVPDGSYDIRVIATDGAGNPSSPILLSAKIVDNTDPSSASVTAPATSAVAGGTISLAAIASDVTAGVGAPLGGVQFQVKPTGAGSFTTVDADTAAPFTGVWDSTGSPDGPAEVRVAVTDRAGNGPLYSAAVPFNVDNTNPNVSLTAPAAASASAGLSATGSADIASVAFAYSPQGAGTWTAISTATGPFTATWTTSSLADGLYDVRATATDVGGRTGTNMKTVRVDRTAPVGAFTQPAAAATVGGTAVALGATASDPAGSGVATVEFLYRAVGSSGPFTPIATATSSPYTATWNVTGVTSGGYDLKALVTDAAGNTFSTTRAVTVDSTPPPVTAFNVPGTLTGSVSVQVTTTADAAQSTYGVSPAGTNTWSTLGTSSVGPNFAVPFNTASRPDGTYDVRASVSDAYGNATVVVVSGVRFDNTRPEVISSVPTDGSVVNSLDTITIDVSEPLSTIDFIRLDGVNATFTATISGSNASFPIGTLPPGNHALTGRLIDLAGLTMPFRVNVTIPGGSDIPATSKNVSDSVPTILGSIDGATTVTVPPNVWQSAPPMAQDFLVLRVAPTPAAGVLQTGVQLASMPVDVRMIWDLAGTEEHRFDAPIEIALSDPTGSSGLPVTFESNKWRDIPRLDTPGQLPASWQDGYWRDGAIVRILTRHLSLFALATSLSQSRIEPPRDFAGVVASDGLTLRWASGIPNEQIANFLVYVDGERIAALGQRQFEAKLGPITPDDDRRFAMTETNLSGRESSSTPVLRVVPRVAGLSVDAASQALKARNLLVGKIVPVYAPQLAPGTVVEPSNVRVAMEGSAIELQVATTSVPRSLFAFSVASAPRIHATKNVLFARTLLTGTARIDVTLDAAPYHRIQRWHFLRVSAGAAILRLKLNHPLKPGQYRLFWKATSSGDQTVQRRITPLRILAPKARPHSGGTAEIVVLTAPRSTQSTLIKKPPKGNVQSLSTEQAYLYATYNDVSVIVLNADTYGLPLVKSFRTVFPTTALIAISKSPTTLAQAARDGAIAVPPSTPTSKLAALIARILGR